MAEGAIDSAVAARSLAVDEISMVHLKQCHDQHVLRSVSSGNVNWQRIGNVLNDLGYRGPVLFEVASSSGVWQHMSTSLDYLAEIEFVLHSEP